MQRQQLDDFDALIANSTPLALRTIAGPMSTGQKCYLALAANDLSILPEGYSIAAAIYRLDAGVLDELIARHKFDEPHT